MNHKECKKVIDESVNNICLDYVINEVLSYIPTGVLSKNTRINKDVQRLASEFNQTASKFIQKHQEYIKEIYQNNKDYIEEIVSLIIEDISLYNIDAPLCFVDFENIITQNNSKFQRLMKITSIYYHFNYYRFLSEYKLKNKDLESVFENYKTIVFNYQFMLGGIKVMNENEMKKLSYDKSTFTNSMSKKKFLFEINENITFLFDNIEPDYYQDYVIECIIDSNKNKSINSKLEDILKAISSIKTEEVKTTSKTVSVKAEIKEDRKIENQSSSSDENKNLLKGLMDDWDIE